MKIRNVRQSLLWLPQVLPHCLTDGQRHLSSPYRETQFRGTFQRLAQLTPTSFSSKAGAVVLKDGPKTACKSELCELGSYRSTFLNLLAGSQLLGQEAGYQCFGSGRRVLGLWVGMRLREPLGTSEAKEGSEVGGWACNQTSS